MGGGCTQCLEAVGRNRGTCCAVGTVRCAVMLAVTEDAVSPIPFVIRAVLPASQPLGAFKSALNCSDVRFSLLLGA